MDTIVPENRGSTITAWTLIVRAQGTGPAASKALGDLLEQHRAFIVWYARKLVDGLPRALFRPPPGLSNDELFQEYAYVFVRSEVVKKLRKYGSLRGFLRTSIEFFISHERRKWSRYAHEEPRDSEPYSPCTEADINSAYLGGLYLQALELARKTTPNSERFETLVRFLPGPQYDPVSQVKLAEELGWKYDRLRKMIEVENDRYLECFEQVVLETLDLGEDANDPIRRRARLEAEINELYAYLEPPAEGVLLDPQREPD